MKHSTPGTYLLIVYLSNAREIEVGKLGNRYFPKGYYIYVGSALNGLEPRIQRHFRKEKKLHWHIDYLAQNGHCLCAIAFETRARLECRIAGYLESIFKPVIDFGCSDCECHSHLFFTTSKRFLQKISALTSTSAANR